MRGLKILVLAAVSAAAVAGPAAAQSPGPYGTEYGYEGGGIGWGPAYRPQTTFRPDYGFYGGTERPYPYARYPEATGSVGGDAYGEAPRYHPRTGAKGSKAARRASRSAQGRTAR